MVVAKDLQWYFASACMATTILHSCPYFLRARGKWFFLQVFLFPRGLVPLLEQHSAACFVPGQNETVFVEPWWDDLTFQKGLSVSLSVLASFLQLPAMHWLPWACARMRCVFLWATVGNVQQRGCRLCNFKKFRCLSNISVVRGKWWDITAKTCIGRKRKVRKGASLSPLEDSIHLTGWAALDFELGCFSGSLWRLFSLETSLYPSSFQVVC